MIIVGNMFEILTDLFKKKNCVGLRALEGTYNYKAFLYEAVSET